MLSVITLVCQEVAGVLTPLSATPAATPTKPYISEMFRLPSMSSDLVQNEVIDEGGGEIEMFAEQEAEDRLDQLLMEEELSDAMLAISADNTIKETGEVVEVEEKTNTKTKDVITRNLDMYVYNVYFQLTLFSLVILMEVYLVMSVKS